MASPAPVAARAARAFAAPRPVTNGESARTRLGPRLFWRPDAASSPRPGPARARAAFSFSSPGSSRRALRRLGFFIEPFVVAAAAEGDGSSAFWDAGDDGPPSFVKLLGREETTRRAQALAVDAEEALGDLAAPVLRQLARFSVERTI